MTEAPENTNPTPAAAPKRNRPGRPSRAERQARIQDTPEFKQAVEAMVLDVMAKLTAAREGATVSAQADSSGDMKFAEALAVKLAEMSSQGIGRGKPVAPQVLQARAEARERMVSLLAAARAEGLRPIYQLRNKVYLDEVLVDPIYVDPATKGHKPTEIEWPGVPNEAMIPFNDVAKDIYKAFTDSIGVVPQEHIVHEAPLAATANGLVIKGGSHATRPIRSLDQGPDTREGLSIKGRGSPHQHKEVRVLGTVASPARVGP